MTGTVVTFYSYKGGVGRSFALSNIAVLLARWGYRVLAVDWDLEAPGLHHYFKSRFAAQPTGGVIDLAADFRAGLDEPRDHAVRVTFQDCAIDLLVAGTPDDDYAGHVQDVDWADLYAEGFAAFLERCRRRWVENYDFVLIDSRTGISDTASICTAHLPDQLVVLFTANEQSVGGAVDVTQRADRARDRLPYDRARHLVLPLLSRLDSRVEYERAEEWQQWCAKVTAPLFRNWLDTTVPVEQMSRLLTLPYVSYWSFGEHLPVLEERTPSPEQISFALETVAAVIAQRFDRSDLLADNRDGYVTGARTHKQQDFDLDLLVSSPRTALGQATALITNLRALGVRVDQSLSGDPVFLDQHKEPARHLCLVVDGSVSRWQATEAERFLRHVLDTDDDRQLFCVLTRDTDADRLPAFLRHLRPLRFAAGVRAPELARQLHDLIAGSPDRNTDTELNALRNAATAVRAVPAELARRGRWPLVEQTIRDMDAALDAGDTELLKDLTVDLEVLSEVRGDRAKYRAPDPLRRRISALSERIDRRVGAEPK